MTDATYQTPVYTAQGGAELHVSSNGRLVVDPGGSVLVQGSKAVDITSARIISSTAGEHFSSANNAYLSSASTPSLMGVSTVDRTLRIAWSSASAIGVQFAGIPAPDDFSTANGVTVKAILGAASASATIEGPDIRFWPGVGGTECGTRTSAITSTAAAVYSVSIAAGDLISATAGGIWTLAVVPSTHAEDPLYLYGLKVEYTRSS